MAVIATASTFGLVVRAAYADPGPTNITPPSIAGVAQQGVQLTADPGTWSGDPITFTYLWSDGTTANTDVPSAADVGQDVSVIVTATNDAGTMSQTVTAGPVLPAAPVLDASGPPPTITGIAQQGVTLSVSNGNWDNDLTGFSYVWEDCDSTGTVCNAISGAPSSSTYTVQSTDVGSTIEVVVTASNAGGQNPATSNSTKTVLPAAPAVTGAPGIGGTPQQGETLTASNGTWNNNPTKFTYAWEDCDSSGNCSAISGATAKTYKLATSDVGKLVSVTVAASNSGGATPVMSAPVGPVLPPAPANTTAPQITVTPAGTPEQGDALSVSNGTWSNAATYTYAWEECDGSGNNCVPIPGATSSSYTLSEADINDTSPAS